ncbi:unnamed protein product [Phytomonas sp. EM1]|nr:unnamed protein product [Phytomonas sp. EM1]|eukprot:CCW62096.1 unnamed protein product [Phytomonas sp. isolate EM1]
MRPTCQDRASGALQGAKRRQAQLHLWTAVALQQHLALERRGPPPSLSLPLPPLSSPLPLPLPPPPPPSEAEWRAVDARATRQREAAERKREQGREVGQEREEKGGCSICQEPFARAGGVEQVVLSCSHVFHARCLHQFERLVRAQWREGGGGRLACPECRATPYYKRSYFAGAALAQRAAVVKIQSVIRGYLARRRYTRLRVQTNPEFRQSYVLEGLERLSRTWERHVERQEGIRRVFLSRLEVQQQAIAGAYLTESDWRGLITRHLLLHDPAPHRDCATDGGEAEKPMARAVATTPCPICLEAIETSATFLDGKAFEKDATATGDSLERESAFCFVPSSTHYAASVPNGRFENGVKALLVNEAEPSDGGKPLLDPAESEAERHVWELRRAYERRRDAAQRQQAEASRKGGFVRGNLPARGERGGRRPSHTRMADAKERRRQEPKKRGAVAAATSPSLEVKMKQNGSERADDRIEGGMIVILSCGHLFHHSCLSAFERYQRWYTASEEGGGDSVRVKMAMPPRCPLCRAGYAKCRF